jgi:hypothetical protein
MQMPILLLKGSRDVNYVNKFDFERFATEDNEVWWWRGNAGLI